MPFYEEPQAYYPVLLDFLARQRDAEAVNASLPLSAFSPATAAAGSAGYQPDHLHDGARDPRRSGAYSAGVRSTPAALARIRAQFALDEPLWVQYGYFLRNLLQGELGKSIVYRVDTLKLIASRLEPTLWLVLGSVLLAVALTVPLAAIAARQRGRLADRLIRLFTTAGLGFPAFWLGIMLILLFSIVLGWFPVSGYGSDF